MSSLPGFWPLCVLAQSLSHDFKSARSCCDWASYSALVASSIAVCVKGVDEEVIERIWRRTRKRQSLEVDVKRGASMTGLWD